MELTIWTILTTSGIYLKKEECELLSRIIIYNSDKTRERHQQIRASGFVVKKLNHEKPCNTYGYL